MDAPHNPLTGVSRRLPAAVQEVAATWPVRSARLVYRMRRRIATGAAVVVALLLGYHVVVGQNGVTAFVQKRTDDRDLKKQIESLQRENERMKMHVERLKNDPDEIEHEARQRLHYARPGEVIYTLNDKPAQTGKGSDPAAKPAETR